MGWQHIALLPQPTFRWFPFLKSEVSHSQWELLVAFNYSLRSCAQRFSAFKDCLLSLSTFIHQAAHCEWTEVWTRTLPSSLHNKLSFWVMLSELQEEDDTLSVALFMRELLFVVSFCWDWSHVGRVTSNLLCRWGQPWIYDPPVSTPNAGLHAPPCSALWSAGTHPGLCAC